MKLNLIVGLLLLGLVACNGSSDDNDSSPNKTTKKDAASEATEAFERQNLAGEIDGQAWTFISGRVSTADEEGKSYLTLWDANIENPCEPAEIGMRTVVAKIELAPGRLELGEESSVMLTSFEGEIPSTKKVKNGVLKISRVDDGQVYGALRAKYDETNYLIGTFQASVCE